MNGIFKAPDLPLELLLQELSSVQETAILCLASMARMRDHGTGNHILRTQHYVRVLATRLRHHPRFVHELGNDTSLELLCRSSILHDIGKVAIPDAILLKPGRLSQEEFEQMKLHTVLGDRVLQSVEELKDGELGHYSRLFLRIAREVVLSHHERWDGTGYPHGLSRNDIPCTARIMAVADVYDALISRRPYKSGLSHGEAAACILEGRGSQFDPAVVDAFEELQQEFIEIAGELSLRYPHREAAEALSGC